MRDVTCALRTSGRDTLFLLTRPMRDVTLAGSRDYIDSEVSTHTPHAGRDELLVTT